ncbi:MAG: hypothetical protein B7Z37_25660 [Verrucomicrobia bacterium 12-59-8]|nr:MAG: hypothetical protein B7Z37_25660 [Verrucomicrobia bacterium 12-59-8]
MEPYGQNQEKMALLAQFVLIPPKFEQNQKGMLMRCLTCIKKRFQPQKSTLLEITILLMLQITTIQEIQALTNETLTYREDINHE